jgi:DNA-directed RNA polymerase subunit RPC12/RpoP
MSKCPRCGGDVRTPFFLDQQGWSGLTCPHCAARLRVKGLRSGAFALLFVSLTVLGPKGHVFAIFAEILMAAMGLVVVLECMHPQLALRKGPPSPEIRLNIGEPRA